MEEDDLAAAAEEDTMQGAGVVDKEGWGDEVRERRERDSERERERVCVCVSTGLVYNAGFIPFFVTQYI